ncbi:MAG: hypothetical protein IJU34_00395 [Bacteroidales bacterium]|nr:hypothetical protein [Bacteroidales bacterium]
MPVFHHIRYARSVRFGESEPTAQDEDCHFLSIYTPFLFGPWERWKDAGILRGISREEWEQRGGALRRQWLDFIR